MKIDIQSIITNLPVVFRRHRVIQTLLRLFPESDIQLLKLKSGASAFVDINDDNARQYIITGQFEAEFFSIVKAFLGNGGHYFDVGANFGLCSFGLIAELPNARIDYHLFEANKDLCHLLRRTALLYPQNRMAINFACVCDSPGESNLAIVGEHLGQSFISAQGDQIVPNLMLDDYIVGKKISLVKFMKMDIEGYEPLALRGATESLEDGKIETIYLEVSQSNLRRARFNTNDCFDILKKTGFELFYCKNSDLTVMNQATQELLVNKQKVRIVALEDFPENHQTDILAIHKTSTYLS